MKYLKKMLSVLFIFVVLMNHSFVLSAADDAVAIKVSINTDAYIEISSDNGPLPEKTRLLIEKEDMIYIPVLSVGTYDYEIRQSSEQDADNIIFDDTVWQVQVTVYYSGNETRIVAFCYKDGDDEKYESITFENEKKQAMIDPPVSKIITGDSPAGDDEFIFFMDGKDVPMPEGSVDGRKTVKIKGSGQFEFGEIVYERPGQYTYEIGEIDGGITGYTYDQTRYTISVLIDDDFVVHTHIYVNDEIVHAITFENKYKKPSTPERIIDKLRIPTTGIKDDRVVYRPNYELLITALAGIVSAVYILKIKTKNKV